MFNIIVNERGELVDTSRCEVLEQKLAYLWIEEDDCVLELGGRYGSVSVIINHKLKNKQEHVVIEPDNRVWDVLEFNKRINNCKFKIIKGFLSKKKMSLINLHECEGYGTRSVHSETSDIPTYTLGDIDMKFNVLVADCEGFLETFFDENPEFISDLRLVIFEADQEHVCNYAKVRDKLREDNFEEILGGHQNVWIKKVDTQLLSQTDP